MGDGSTVPISTQPKHSGNEVSSHFNKQSSISDQQSPSINTIPDFTRRSLRQSTPHTSIRDTKYENIDLDSGISSHNSNQRDSIISDSTMNDSVIDEDCQFELDTDDNIVDSESYYRHSMNMTGPRSAHIKTHRSHSTSTCRPYQHAHEYEKMINPKGVQKDEYVEMRPVTRLYYAQSMEQSSYPLELIKERNSQEVSSCYENFSIAPNIPNSRFLYYSKQYENTERFQEKRNGSNHSVRSTSPNTNKAIRHVYGSAV